MNEHITIKERNTSEPQELSPSLTVLLIREGVAVAGPTLTVKLTCWTRVERDSDDRTGDREGVDNHICIVCRHTHIHT